MKISATKFFTVAVCAVFLSIMCIAAGTAVLSPAFDKIEKDIKLQKCGVVNTAVKYDKADFDKVFCSKPEFIKIESLPAIIDGELMIGSFAVSQNQIISREDFDRLTFVPTADSECAATFEISNASPGSTSTHVLCTVNVLDGINLAPVTKDQSVFTSENISAFKFLNARDPEKDIMSFEICSYPEHGHIGLSDDSSGYFCYSPNKGYTGSDSFEYEVMDCFGNRSKPAKVQIKVSEPLSDVYFDDLKSHWAHNSAQKMAARGLMEGVIDTETGAYNFNPGETVTRGDFLAMALISAGKEGAIDFVTETTFADDAEIPVNIKSYAEYAKTNGIVTGYISDDDTQVFDSHSAITRAEAAVIVDRILELPEAENGIAVFADSSECPDWAGASLSNLSAYGIINGTGYGEIMPENLVTRAETAEILCNAESYLVSAFSPVKEKKSRNILNLFGLLD